MTTAERMAALFPGNPNAHYVADFTQKTTKKGKVKPRYECLTGPATLADFEAHLAGTIGLLDIPVDEHGMTRGGVIDLDEYNKYSAEQINGAIFSHRLPLIPAHTKSGGWHLSWFFRDMKKAADVRAQLDVWAKLLGFKKYEIFPKQQELEPGAVGNGINLPYFGGDQEGTKNYAVDLKGMRMSVEQWLNRIDTTPAEWVPLDAAPDAAVNLIVKYWSDGQRHKFGRSLTGFLLNRGDKSTAYCKALLDMVSARTDLDHETIDPENILKDLNAGKRIEGFPKLCEVMGEQDAKALAAAFGIAVTAETVVEREPIVLLSCTREELMAPLREETYLVEGMVPTEAYTLIAGALSSYKTMLMLNLLIWRATGHNLLALPEIDDPAEGGPTGPSVLLTYEDIDRRILERLKRIAQHGFQLIRKRHGVARAEKFAGDITKNLQRVPMSGKFGKTLICRLQGTVIPNMAFVEELLAAVKTFASAGVLIGLDPLRLALVGSQNDDDGADVAVNVLNYIASALPDSGLVVCSHTTKSGAKEPGTGYADASYSTSGSALYSQHARSNFLMARLSSEDIGKQFDMRVLSQEDAQQQRVARLTHGRLSHGAESIEQYVRMHDGVLLPIEPLSGRTAATVMDDVLPWIAQAIERLVASKSVISKNALSHDAALKSRIGGEKKIRDHVALLEDEGFVEFNEVANKHKTGALTQKGRDRVALLEQVQADRCHSVPRSTGVGT